MRVISQEFKQMLKDSDVFRFFMDVVRLATSFSEYTLYLKCKSRYIWIFDDTIVLFCCKEFYKSTFVGISDEA